MARGLFGNWLAASQPTVAQRVGRDLGTYALPVKKRELRMFARVGSLLAAALLVLNVLTMHAFITFAWSAAVILVILALANLIAAFAEEGSFRSFLASMMDFGFAFGAGCTFMLQSGAYEIDSPTLRMGMHLLAFILEVWLVAINLGATLLGQAADDIAFKKR